MTTASGGRPCHQCNRPVAAHTPDEQVACRRLASREWYWRHVESRRSYHRRYKGRRDGETRNQRAGVPPADAEHEQAIRSRSVRRAKERSAALFGTLRGDRSYPRLTDRPWTGERVRALRTALDLTQLDLATAVGLGAPNTISRWETETQPVPSVQWGFLDWLDVHGHDAIAEARASNAPRGPSDRLRATDAAALLAQAQERDRQRKEQRVRDASERLARRPSHRAGDEVWPGRIARIRRAFGMDRPQLAGFIGRLPSTVEGWERGLAVPTGGSATILELLDEQVASGAEQPRLPLPKEIVERQRRQYLSRYPVAATGGDRWTAERVLHLRMCFGLSGTALAEQIGVSHQTVNNWERDRVEIAQVNGDRLDQLEHTLLHRTNEDGENDTPATASSARGSVPSPLARPGSAPLPGSR